ncbi:MAG: hypothetical protein COW47_02395 [Candidatus Huberarchaeum crystalense]|uniref:Uncharacterized protein n=1 Tax=Huberarchaeum crystalense TaxID=2014257 RepID=A0A2G9LIZ1_HUBC1|nr:MAG: hypothetical protein COW69_02055 [Candidatus Huberarchaeum crystalense]PIV13844.1 MAG: hypothetical protein COS45_00725 [Candidatus Huberarchaeum crystalense]PIV46333.1 MAG: hypothetical protein COS22_02000 [Candidatus Huberarchaeum crystalense]PIV89559.1 MAG: hypothetical protein COW47_02395 [Candidatus Huberarchaeum crystalense]PIX28135.1 MAG: hypothetical protein COZ66_01110 [Candidatus Huberarchaeum crystalense]
MLIATSSAVNFWMCSFKVFVCSVNSMSLRSIAELMCLVVTSIALIFAEVSFCDSLISSAKVSYCLSFSATIISTILSNSNLISAIISPFAFAIPSAISCEMFEVVMF